MKPSDWKITGTREAFDFMISKRGIYKKLGVTPPTVSSWKRSLNGKDSRGVSLDKMEEMLIKGGFSVYEDKVWNINVNNPK